MAKPTRDGILSALRAKIASKKPIIGGGAGTGISAKWEEAGGIDLIVIYNSGRYRMAGRGSLSGLLAYGNANDIVLELAREVIPVVKKTPILAGINGTDPFVNWDVFLRRIIDEGFAGVQNFPTVGLIDGVFRANLEETGMGYGLEVEAIERAGKMGLITTPYVFNTEDAKAMAKAGADILVAHMGLTTSGSIGAQTAKSLDDSVKLIDEIADAARGIRKDIIILCHGGPIAMPKDAQYVLKNCKDINGFYGASSMERLPTEVAIKAQVEEFGKLTF
ncbi:MAG: phosphoenolpyruvate hydrolase family protein [Synergistaceae bacterium]|jgi:predicted TIM-barrel enzyme|nr:phosphoenolpyruvate hydrolase family protein [Synergistaceae bacterium]